MTIDLSSVLCENWEYADSDTKKLTHNIHRYSGKFIPQIASRAVSLLTVPGELVVDPYNGSGTTLLECAQLRRRGIGVDLNPLAVLIARVKTTPVSKTKLDDLLRKMKGDLLSPKTEDDIPLFSGAIDLKERTINEDPRLHDDWYRKWFQPQVLTELVRIALAIDGVEEQSLQNIARVAFSDILRRSSNAHSGYPNVMLDKNAPMKDRPIRPFLKALERVTESVSSLAKINVEWTDVKVLHGDATALPIEDGSVDAVISHPPYIGSIPYAEYGALSLQWLGADPKKLDRELTGGRRQSADVVARFKDGYGNMLRESARVLKHGRYTFLMVGNPIVRGQLIDLAEMTVQLALKAGFELVVRTERHGVNRRANKMGAEHLLFFRKV